MYNALLDKRTACRQSEVFCQIKKYDEFVEKLKYICIVFTQLIIRAGKTVT